MGKIMDAEQKQLRQQLRGAIAKYQAREIGLRELLPQLFPHIEGLEPEAVWNEAESLFTELDVTYAQHDPDTPWSTEDQQEADRIASAMDRLLTDGEAGKATERSP